MPFMKNRSFNVKMVKDNPDGSTPLIEINPFAGPEIAAAYAEVAKDLITHAAFTIGGVWAACKIVERICK